MPHIIVTDRQNIEYIIEAEQSVTLMEAIKLAGLDELSRWAALLFVRDVPCSHRSKLERPASADEQRRK